MEQELQQCQICRVKLPRDQLKWIHQHRYCQHCYALVKSQSVSKKS